MTLYSAMQLSQERPIHPPHGTVDLFSGPFMVPADVTSVDLICISGGGSGQTAPIGSATGGRGGGGSACVAVTGYAVTPGQTLQFNLGTGGYNGTAGKITYMRKIQTGLLQTPISVRPGLGGGATGDTGGDIAGCFVPAGGIAHAGGNTVAAVDAAGTIGGGSGGPTGDGVDSIGNPPGGDGREAGIAGNAYGGGGGGGNIVNGISEPGGSGARGLIRITY